MNRRVDVKKNEVHCYDIVIERGFGAIVDELDKLNIKGIKLCIVTDSNVGPIYADKLKSVLEKTGNSIYVFTIPAGEKNKNLSVVETVYTYLIEQHFERRDMIVALGGGSPMDAAKAIAAAHQNRFLPGTARMFQFIFFHIHTPYSVRRQKARLWIRS